MLRHIKYWLLTLLLDDICKKTDDCEHCECVRMVEVCGVSCQACIEGGILRQAWKAWKMDRR